MLKPWIHKIRQKKPKQMIKQQKKTTKEEKSSTLPAKSFFLLFLWAYGSRGNSREFFSTHFWSLLQFCKKQPFMNRTLQLSWVISILSLWYFARWRIWMLFFWGLEIKPCESRLEFAHPQKIKNTKKQMTKNGWWGDGKNYQRRRKKFIACKIIFFTLFLGLWV